MIYIYYPNGVLDIRNFRVYSEVYCEEKNAKYFVEYGGEQ